MSHLAGKVAVITGGSSGIGLATAKRFAHEGAYVFITGRRASELDKAKAEIGKNVTTVQGDVTNLADLDRLYDTVKAEKAPWTSWWRTLALSSTPRSSICPKRITTKPWTSM
jgi:NAD(P)-dependent dehydrogenase (short-subunit alcohol dehydrogenase family)